MAVMMSPREKWTDERLDDLNEKVDRGFADLKAEMKEGFEKIDARFAQMDARFAQIDARFEKVDQRFERIDERFERMQQALFAAAVAIIVAMIGSTATLAGIALF